MEILLRGKLIKIFKRQRKRSKGYLNLQTYCYPYQTTRGIFHRTGTNNSRIFMEPQKTLIAKTIMKRIKIEVSCSLILIYTSKI